MARKPMIECAGAVYHVRNRGNYRGDLLATAGAALAFATSLGEACERMGWRVHADCLMRNHDHLALETPRGNLVAGVRWSQRTLGNRFNRYRGELGRALQGRSRAIVVEPGVHLACLVGHNHLNAVWARLVELEQWEPFRWSSDRAFGRGADERAAWLCCEDWLRTHGELPDAPEGWLSSQHHLAWLLADTGRQTEAAFGTMSQGWALGSKDYQREALADLPAMESAAAGGGAEAVKINRRHWHERLEAVAKAIGASLLSAAGNINRPKPAYQRHLSF